MFKPTDLIPTCPIHTPRDPETGPLLGGHRFPPRTAPRVVAVDDLAFCRPSSIGDQGGRIESIAHGKGDELPMRGECLRDQGGHLRAYEEYFRIQIGGLEQLTRPVTAEKWKRVTLLYTTAEYLVNPKILNDLVVEAQNCQTHWRSLQERAENEQLDKVDLPEADVPPDESIGGLGIKESPSTYDISDLD